MEITLAQWDMAVDSQAKAFLIAGREAAEGVVIYRFDIRFQGENETAFFDA